MHILGPRKSSNKRRLGENNMYTKIHSSAKVDHTHEKAVWLKIWQNIDRFCLKWWTYCWPAARPQTRKKGRWFFLNTLLLGSSQKFLRNYFDSHNSPHTLTFDTITALSTRSRKNKKWNRRRKNSTKKGFNYTAKKRKHNTESSWNEKSWWEA